MFRSAFFTSLIINALVGAHLHARAKDSDADCEKYYFGLGAEKDLPRAFKSCWGSGSANILILMYLNGEGTPYSLKMADTIVQREIKREKAEGWGPDATLSNLEEIIEKWRVDPSKRYHLGYGDIAMTTVDMNYYGEISQQLQEQEDEKLLKSLVQKMDARSLAAFGKVTFCGGVLITMGDKRAYTDNIAGTIRVIASQGYHSYLAAHQRQHLREWLGDGHVPKCSKAAFEAADRELNSSFRKKIARVEEDMKSLREMQSHWLDEYKDYFPLLREEQRVWIKYRDAWVELLASRGPDADALAAGVAEALTKERSEELLYDPIAPEGE